MDVKELSDIATDADNMLVTWQEYLVHFETTIS